MGRRKKSELQAEVKNGSVIRLKVPRKRIKKEFLRLYRVFGNVKEVLDVLGVRKATLDLWLATDPQFKAQFEDLPNEILDELEGFAYKAAKGEVKLSYANALMLQFMLRSLAPHKYLDKAQQEKAVVTNKQQMAEILKRLADALEYGGDTLQTGDSEANKLQTDGDAMADSDVAGEV